MTKKTITLILMALLVVVGAKADVIPSRYYSEVGEGTFYIYNVTVGKFLRTAGVSENNYSLLDAPVAVTLTAKGETTCKGGGGYILSGNDNCFIKIGQYNGQWLWSNAASGNADILAWTFNNNGTNTYTMSVTLSEAFSQNNSTLVAGTYYMKDVTNLGSEAEAGTYALITEADYYAYLASTTMIPSTYYTTTPTADTYYLYNIERSGFIYRGGDGNYAGLKTTASALTLTSNGAGAFYIKFSDETKYLKTGEYNGCYVWTDATDESFAWTFEPFHGVTGLFFVKCPLNEADRYLYSSGIGVRGVNAWTTPDANRTQYAWALISETDYNAWKSNVVLSDANITGFTASGDVPGVNVTVNRAMTANVWNTLVVPFDMAIPEGWTVKEPTAFDGTTITFGTPADGIKAGKPYIVKPTEAVTSFSATGVTLKKDLVNTTIDNLTMTGTYTAGTVPTGSYIIGIKDGVSKLYLVDSDVSIKPFRAYFTVSGGSRSTINMVFDNEASGISDASRLMNNEERIKNVYDLQGRRVRNAQPNSQFSILRSASPLGSTKNSQLQKGLYIVNGKKVIIK